MARQNSMLPKGAFPHLRPPHAETNTHDPAQQGHSLHTGYQQPYEQQGHADHGGQAPLHPSNPRDIFNTLRTEQQQGLTSRLEAFTTPTGSRFDPPRQDYGAGGYSDPSSGQAYQAHAGYGQGYDAYGRPLPAGYGMQGGYPVDGTGGHDPRHYDGHHDPLQHDPRYAQIAGHGYGAPQDSYGRDDGYPYDSYQPDGAHAYGAQPGLQQGAEGNYYPDEYPEEGEPETRRGPRAIVVVGALLAAIGLGGGLAYGYKSLTSGGSGKLPILRADTAPAKAQPTDPGGKQVAHTDKKFLNRLTDDRGPRPVPVSIQPPPASERDAAASGEGGPRRVPTLVVNRDGSIAPTGAAQGAPPPMSSVPGMVIEGLPPRMPAPQLREAQQPAPPPAAPSIAAEEVRPAPPLPTRRVAAAQPTVSPAPPAVVAPPAPRADVERPRPPARQAARTEPAAPAPSTAATTSGYVAVLSSRKSHMDALKTFADMQQKYSSVLQGRTPDVREANLGEKGVWYRVVVGPPGSREAANGVCSQLKSAGYTGCWIMNY